MIRRPPEAPTTIFTSPFSSTMIDGQVEDKGRFPGPGAFALGHGYAEPFVALKKSASSLLYMIPDVKDRNFAPNLQ